MADHPPNNFEAWRDHLNQDLHSSQGRNGSTPGRREQSQENPNLTSPGNNRPSTHFGFRDRSPSLIRDSQFLGMNSSPTVSISPNRFSFGAGPDAAAAERMLQRDGLYQNIRRHREALAETTGDFFGGWGSVSRASVSSYETNGTEETRGFRRHTSNYQTVETPVRPITFVGRRRQDRNDRGDARRRPLTQSSNSLWRHSIEDSVEELRAAQRRRFENVQNRVQSQDGLSGPNTISTSMSTGTTQTSSSRTGRELFTEHLLRAARQRRRLQELNQATAEPTSAAESYAQRAPNRGIPSSRAESTGLELNSRYLGEFTLGLVKKSDPTVTLDQAILDAEREVREMFPGARAVAVTSERIGSFGSSTELTEGILRAGLSESNINAPSFERTEIMRQIAEDRADARNRLRSALNQNDGTIHTNSVSEPDSQNTLNQNQIETSDASSTPTNQPREPPSLPAAPALPGEVDSTANILARALELNANIDRLQAAMDLCQENRDYLQGVNRMLAERHNMLERHKEPQPSSSASVANEVSDPVSDNTPTSPAEGETRDFCLSIWETEPPGGSSNPGGLPILQAYVTELPSLRTREEDQSDGVGDSSAVPVPEDEGELTIDDSSSSDSDDDFNAWDAHSTMRNFTESTFNVDSDWEDRFGEEGEIFQMPAREGVGRTMRPSRAEQRRDLSPATLEFHRSIGIRDSEEDDDGTFNGYIMMPAPLTAPDNLLGEATPKPLFHGQQIDENTTGSEEESEDTSSSAEDEVEDEALQSQNPAVEQLSDNNDGSFEGEQSNISPADENSNNSDSAFDIKGQSLHNGDKRIQVNEIVGLCVETTDESETKENITGSSGQETAISSTTEHNNIKETKELKDGNTKVENNEVASKNIGPVLETEVVLSSALINSKVEINETSKKEAAGAGDCMIVDGKNSIINTNSVAQNTDEAEVSSGMQAAKKESGFKLFYNRLTSRIKIIKKKGKPGDGVL